VALKDSLYISSPVFRSSVSGSVMSHMNAGFVLVLWLHSLSLGGVGVMGRLSPPFIVWLSPCLHRLGFCNLEKDTTV